MAEYNRITAPHVRPSRQGLKTIVTYVPEELSDALRHLSIDVKKPLQQIAEEGLVLALKSYGVDYKPPKKKGQDKDASAKGAASQTVYAENPVSTPKRERTSR